MNFERVAAEIRPRSYPESVDLGFCLYRAWWKTVLGAWIIVGLPLFAGALVLLRGHPGLVALAVWWVKPLFGRVALFVLSRGLFGHLPTIGETLRAWPGLLRRDLFGSLTWRRIDPIRSFRMPVFQLEGQSGKARRQRLRLLLRDVRFEAVVLTLTCSLFELCIVFGLTVAALTFFPVEQLTDWLRGEMPLQLSWTHHWFLVGCYVAAVALIEPFYVAGGFGLYVNRRTLLEAWDIEVVFHRMTARLRGEHPGAGLARVVVLLALLAGGVPSWGQQPGDVEGEAGTEPTAADARRVIDEVLADPVFGVERTEVTWQFRESKRDRPPRRFEAFDRLANAFAIAARAGAVAVAVAALIWVGYELARRYGRRKRPVVAADEDDLPTELFGLDVREASLPADIAAEARASWDAGRRSDAIRLLYRGALARLISRDGLPVKPSSTEGDCVELAARHVSHELCGYLRRLTETWLVSAYGHRQPDDASGPGLIVEWESHFGGAS